MSNKIYKCEYFRVISRDNESGDEELYDLLEIIEDLNPSNYEENAKPYRDDYIRIEDVYFNQTFDKWFFRFVRIRNRDFPLLCRINEESVEMEREDGQLIAEPMVCLYDSDCSILMVQKNYDSVSLVGLKDYFNEFVDGKKILLDPIIDTNATSRIRSADKVTKVKVRLSEVAEFNNESNFLKTSFGSVFRKMSDIPLPFVEITLSVGHEYRTREVNHEESMELLSVIEENKESFDRAEYTIREENKSHLVNVFADVVSGKMEFDLSEDGILRFDVVMQKMGEIYNGSGADPGQRRYLLNILYN